MLNIFKEKIQVEVFGRELEAKKENQMKILEVKNMIIN